MLRRQQGGCCCHMGHSCSVISMIVRSDERVRSHHQQGNRLVSSRSGDNEKPTSKPRVSEPTSLPSSLVSGTAQCHTVATGQQPTRAREDVPRVTGTAAVPAGGLSTPVVVAVQDSTHPDAGSCWGPRPCHHLSPGQHASLDPAACQPAHHAEKIYAGLGLDVECSTAEAYICCGVMSTSFKNYFVGSFTYHTYKITTSDVVHKNRRQDTKFLSCSPQQGHCVVNIFRIIQVAVRHFPNTCPSPETLVLPCAAGSARSSTGLAAT